MRGKMMDILVAAGILVADVVEVTAAWHAQGWRARILA